ncbi:DUF2125 domain-containing protein [Limimaricola pyoseonensis]|uniref:DUF2125 domain-containing protein n=1 Tax=Limimaricola pyoseonensis TaxID=521013 RepID=A0A1G7F0G5_9RHOB|nr:DUF2125 domain-containing protein [Limimaricola pyoseonensis]SDE69392.1 hypothetical protein SAMN04488567_2372 [Limimaricola pyoseonensis]
MTAPIRFAPAACAAALILPAAAQAEVTAAQVWQDWQAGAALWGETEITTQSEEMAGDTLTITGLELVTTGPDGRLEVSLPELRLTETAEGTVEVALSESYPVRLISTVPGEEGEARLQVRQQDLEVTVGGTPEAMRYDYAASRYTIALEEVTEAGTAIPAEAAISFNAIDGSYLTQTGADGQRMTDYDIAADSLDISVDATDMPGEAGPGSLKLRGSVADFALTAALALPEGMAEAPEGTIPEGFETRLDYATGPALIEFDVTDPEARVAGTARTGGGEVAFALDPARMSYDSRTRALDLALSESPVPFPLSLQIDEYGVGLDMPLAAGAAAQDFSGRVTLDGLALNEEVWRLFDPMAVLPREPATLIAELSGAAVLPQDLTAPETAEAVDNGAAMAEAAPELQALTLERLVLRLAGAELLGDGAFTFDNSDFETFEGIPRPEGQIDLRISGLNGLMQNLSTLGVIPTDQLMGARMMLGLFTTPVGEDELTSTIEINAEGQVIANGQRLQ